MHYVNRDLKKREQGVRWHHLCHSPRDSVEADISQSSPLYLCDTVDEEGGDTRDGVGAE